MQFYTDRTRRHLPYALPDAEVFHATVCLECGTIDEPCSCAGQDGRWSGLVAPRETGWYWWACFPGCLPDSEPIGPFPNAFRAIRDARRY